MDERRGIAILPFTLLYTFEIQTPSNPGRRFYLQPTRGDSVSRCGLRAA
jgi:hypothetical protein